MFRGYRKGAEEKNFRIDPIAGVRSMNALEVARLKWRAIFLITP